MIIKLMVGDTVFTTYDDVPDGSRTSANMAMTMTTDYGQTLVMEFEQIEEDAKSKTYAMSHAFTLREAHINALENLKKDLAVDAPKS